MRAAGKTGEGALFCKVRKEPYLLLNIPNEFLMHTSCHAHPRHYHVLFSRGSSPNSAAPTSQDLPALAMHHHLLSGLLSSCFRDRTREKALTSGKPTKRSCPSVFAPATLFQPEIPVCSSLRHLHPQHANEQQKQPSEVWCSAAAVLPGGRLSVVGGGCYSAMASESRCACKSQTSLCIGCSPPHRGYNVVWVRR